VDLPSVGEVFEKGEAYGSVESVKAASDVYAPVGGEVLEINKDLEESPEMVNESAESNGWFIKLKVKDASEMEGLLDAAAYAEYCKTDN